MIRAFTLSLAQLGDRAVLIVLAKSLVATGLFFLALATGGRWLVDRYLFDGGEGDIAVALVALLLGWLFLRVVLVAAVGVFADDIVAAVERRHYPAMLAKARDVPLARALRMGLGSGVRVLLVNLALLPVFAALLFLGVVGMPVLFFIANAWLLGRDLGDMVAARHLAPDAMPAWRRRTRTSRLLVGGVAQALIVIPFLGLLAPVIGAAMATHLFHQDTP